MNVIGAALGGMRDAQSKLEKSADRIAGTSGAAPDSVDLSTETVGLLAARDQFQANARVFQTGDDMQRKVLDILA
jgi:flagellar hook protein FlgE